MDEKHELWMGPTISTYAQTIVTSAPDAIVTLGVLLYILAHRAYSGRLYGWTQIPVQYMATRGQMRFTRVRAALSWLEKQGMIVPGTKQKYQARWYKVVLRTLEKRQAVLKSTPKAVDKGPTTKVVYWSPSTATVEWQTVSSEYANSLLKCSNCNNFYDPTLGCHPEKEGRCIACYLREIIKRDTPVDFVLEVDKYHWTVKKVNEFLTSFENHVDE